MDDKGVVNFTDDYTKVPPAFRNRVKTEGFVQQEGKAAPAQRTVAAAKEEIRTDIYGRDRTWWRGKARPWKDQLKEASENYKETQKEYMEQAEGLGPYQKKMAEAKSMLAELSKEAKETGADPAWLE